MEEWLLLRVQSSDYTADKQGVSMSFIEDIPEFVILSRDTAHVDQSSLEVHQSCSCDRQFEDLHVSQFRGPCECRCVHQGNFGNGRQWNRGEQNQSC